MNLELRKFRDSEYERLAAIRNSIFSDPISSQEIRSSDDSFDTKYYRQRYSCFNQDTGEIVAFGSIGHMAWSFHPQRFVGSILVDKAYQNRGIGQYVYENMLEFLAKLNANELLASAREDMPVSATFLKNRGFEETQRISESTLDTTKVDVSSFSRYMEKVNHPGVEISSLSHELENDPECYRKLYELNMTLMRDVVKPRPYTPISYEQWVSFDMRDKGLLPDAYAIAKHGSSYVGLSTVRRLDKDPKGLHQLLTGVRKDHRGKGIAIAMKLMVIEYAKNNGYNLIRTENSTLNAEMLGINTKLGFERGPAWITFTKTLVSPVSKEKGESYGPGTQATS